jgi:integrase
LADGSRRRINPPFPKGTSKAYAKERAKFWSEDAQKRGIVKAEAASPSPLTPNDSNEAWFKAWTADRRARGFTTVHDNESHYNLHIVKSIGDKHVRDWTRDDLRKLSRDLDSKVQSSAFSWKTAINIWSTATKMCGDAAESKRDDIRCRADDPSDGVRGPDRGIAKGKQFLYPSEFRQFVQCADVPLRWRRVVAVAIYLYMRDGELRVLDCEDVDGEHLSVHVTKALDKKAKPEPRVKSTKGRRRRHVPIEAPVLPLLEAYRAEAGSCGRIFGVLPSERDMARGLRRWLKRAGVTRRELHEGTPTTRPIRFHDLRATGCTWMAVRGDDPLKIQQRAGHEDFETTQEYIRLAEVMRGGFGDVFPALPPELYERSIGADEGSFAGEFRSHESITATQVLEIWRGGRDSNPRPPA